MGEFKRFLFEYRHDGAEWGIEIAARDADDARARMRAMPLARLQGEVVASGTLPDGGSLVALVRRWASRLWR